MIPKPLSPAILQKNFELSKNSQQNLLGWFRFRKNTSLKPSLREISVHTNLEKIIRSQQQKFDVMKEIPFLFGLFTMNSSQNGGTHTYDYRVMSIDSSITHAVDLNITNLIHSSQTEYNDFTPLSPLTYCVSSKDLTQLIGKMPLYTQDLEKFFEFTLHQLKTTVDNVYQSTSEIKRLEEEIKKLNETS